MKRVVVALLAAFVAAFGLMCGGTTGREDLPLSATATAPVDATAADANDGGASLDATLGFDSLYTNTFDVALTYADRQLPDVQEAEEGGAQGGEDGGGLPFFCAPFIPVNYGTTQIVPLGQEGDQVPAVYLDGGPEAGETFAPDGGVCATYPWLGSTVVDECVTSAAAGSSSETTPFLPPCNWAIGTGAATAGPMEGTSLYDLCIALYQCYMRTACYLKSPALSASSVAWCYCGTTTDDPQCQSAPSGQCLQEELAAFEVTSTDPGQEFAQVVNLNFAALGITGPGAAASALNFVFSQITSGCSGPAVLAAEAAGLIDASAVGTGVN